jgi:hypothetical protein
LSKVDRLIRIPNTALGTILLECYEPETLHLHPWWHESCHLAGEKLPFFRVTLRRVESRWTIVDFRDSFDPAAPEWPRGAREKVPKIAIEIGAAWAAAHESLIRERGTEYLKQEVNDLVERPADNLELIRRAIAHANYLNRLDLLEPIRPLIGALANEFLQAEQMLKKAHRRRLAA